MPSGNTLPFTRRRLAILLGTGVLLHACSTLPESAPTQSGTQPGAERSESISAAVAAIRSERQGRAMGVPRRQLPGMGADRDGEDLVITDLWQRMRLGFHFALQHDNDDIREALDWYAGNPDFIQQVAEQARPYLYLVIDEIEQRGLPLELALLPIVESAYNPNAVSPQSAVGLWQFMPATATGMGLKRDWWYDGRRDPLASTRAALDYLEYLYLQFDGDWLLALAAYNMGQGNLQRSIRNNESNGEATDFWSLAVPTETQRHVPRILALAHLINGLEEYGIETPLMPNEPEVIIIEAESQVDLALVAELAGLEPEIVYRLNPGYRQWATHPDGPHTLLLPSSHADQAINGLASLGEEQRVTWDRYEVQPGDTLGAIAQRYRTRVSALQDANRLSGSRIVAGDTLLIPRAYNTGGPIQAPDAPLYSDDVDGRMTAPTYEVRSGDNLWQIATRHRIDMRELARWNNLDIEGVLQPGQMLRLQPADAVASNVSGNHSIEYQVRAGDSLYRIARQHGLNVEEIVEWNDMRADDTIFPGQHLLLHVSETN